MVRSSPLPEVVASPHPRQTRRRARILAFVLIASALVVTIAVGNRFLPARAFDVFHAYLTYGVAGGALGAAGSWLLSRGGGGALVRAVVAAPSLFAAMMITGGALLAVNQLADGSAGVEHRAKIVKKSALSNRKSPGDYDRTSLRNTVSVQSWLDGDGKLIEVRVVGVAAWEQLQPGDVIPVSVHEGALGWPWVSPYVPN